ncbi:plasmid partitioning protein RepB C-terminal domain-containing protein [Acetobacter sp.]|jgi:ParB-like chromosome segregation protein Spo0J|uniref:plasmid partitioning protein RepB C-terminal domain-containing protein n=1 Tax=Acetobacter sp. TaxID=440 RepID=UPI0025C259F4|nr:plasmid partitioning protein RepB C-terminal domain-containing protein [Acetobacter sp.]MCH4092022.1 ParB N-terminal domain-containing protein [Acetobacter sp.]MCI1300723.1 ParB N-terminal domain-containing protein [Acetobacter sp.]MCI1317524.1 ParB N-terminal domain-containing protein [Acetobacter sp.]
MSKPIRISFERKVYQLPLGAILPLRPMTKRIIVSKRYERIATTVGVVGVIEPLAVAKADREGRHMLLDGHLRLHALQEQQADSAPCIISDDDEAFTYNKRVNRLATVQEHYMISRAIDRGVPPAMIATALGIEEKMVMRRRSLLDGIAPGAVEILKDRPVNMQVFDILRKMKPYKQTETAELMVAMNNLTAAYAKAILAATRQTDLAKPDRPKITAGITPDQMARMEREMEKLTKDYRAIEATFGDDVLQLVLAGRYLERLIENTKIISYLEARYPEIIAEFRVIVSATSLDAG